MARLSFVRVPAVALALAALLPSAASAESPKALGLREVQQRPLLWPDTLATTVPLSDGRKDHPQGTEVAFFGFDPQGLVVQFPGDDQLTLLQVNMTDLLDRAAAQAAALPEEAQSLTFDDLVNRADLYPAVVRLTQDVEFPDKMRETGRDIGAYKVIQQPDRSYVLAALDPDLAAQGVFHQRQSYTMDQTDFLSQLRAQFSAAESTPSRDAFLADARSRLVDAAGNPVAATDDEQGGPRFYVIYSAAKWCGFCAKFNPKLVETYNEIQAAYPGQVEFIYFGSDRSAEEMQAHLTETGIKFPAIRFEERTQARSVLGLLTGSTPQVVVVGADGRIFHDGSPAGAPGAQAALAALKRELAKGN